MYFRGVGLPLSQASGGLCAVQLAGKREIAAPTGMLRAHHQHPDRRSLPRCCAERDRCGARDYGRAAAALAGAVMDLYPHVAALRMASRASAAVISGVVWQFRKAPPAANARAIAAAEMLSGISVMTMASCSPNAKY